MKNLEEDFCLESVLGTFLPGFSPKIVQKSEKYLQFSVFRVYSGNSQMLWKMWPDMDLFGILISVSFNWDYRHVKLQEGMNQQMNKTWHPKKQFFLLSFYFKIQKQNNEPYFFLDLHDFTAQQSMTNLFWSWLYIKSIRKGDKICTHFQVLNCLFVHYCFSEAHI